MTVRGSSDVPDPLKGPDVEIEEFNHGPQVGEIALPRSFFRRRCHEWDATDSEAIGG